MNEGRGIGLQFQSVQFLTQAEEPSSDVVTPVVRPPASSSGMSPGAGGVSPGVQPPLPPPSSAPPTTSTIPTKGVKFQLYTFGVRMLAYRFPDSRVANNIFNMVNCPGYPKVPWGTLCGP